MAGITFSTYTSHKGSGDSLLLTGDRLYWTVKKLREAWKKNRDIVFLSPFIIDLFENKKHRRRCYFREKGFMSLDADLNVKEPCVMGKGVDCRTCGCIVPMVSYAMKHADVRAWLLFDKFFPEKGL